MLVKFRLLILLGTAILLAAHLVDACRPSESEDDFLRKITETQIGSPNRADRCNVNFYYAKMKITKSITQHTSVFISKSCGNGTTGYYVYHVVSSGDDAAIVMYSTSTEYVRKLNEFNLIGAIRDVDWSVIVNDLARFHPITYFSMADSNCRLFVMKFMRIWTGHSAEQRPVHFMQKASDFDFAVGRLAAIRDAESPLAARLMGFFNIGNAAGSYSQTNPRNVFYNPIPVVK